MMMCMQRLHELGVRAFDAVHNKGSQKRIVMYHGWFGKSHSLFSDRDRETSSLIWPWLEKGIENEKRKQCNLMGRHSMIYIISQPACQSLIQSEGENESATSSEKGKEGTRRGGTKARKVGNQIVTLVTDSPSELKKTDYSQEKLRLPFWRKMVTKKLYKLPSLYFQLFHEPDLMKYPRKEMKEHTEGTFWKVDSGKWK